MPTSYMSSSIREWVKYGVRGSDGQEVMKSILKLTCLIFLKERLDGKVLEVFCFVYYYLFLGLYTYPYNMCVVSWSFLFVPFCCVINDTC